MKINEKITNILEEKFCEQNFNIFSYEHRFENSTSLLCK